MRVTTSPGENTMQIASGSQSVSRLKRVDLVVTDSENFDGFADGADPDASRRESRCTILLGLLDGDITHDALREIAQAFHASGQDPIRPEDFLQLISDLAFARQRRESPGPPIDQARVERLTRRERQVLDHVVAGHPNKLTAVALEISRRTVEHHRAAIMQKTRAKSVSELVRLALRTGLSDMADDRAI